MSVVGGVLQCLRNYWGIGLHVEADLLHGWDYKAGVAVNSLSQTELCILTIRNTVTWSSCQTPDWLWFCFCPNETENGCHVEVETKAEVKCLKFVKILFVIYLMLHLLNSHLIEVCMSPKMPQTYDDCFLEQTLTEGHHLHFCAAVSPHKINVLRLWQYATLPKGAKEVNASGKTFTVRSSLQLHVDRNDDGVAYTCKVDHVALTQTPQQTTEVLVVHCESTHSNTHTCIIQYLWT